MTTPQIITIVISSISLLIALASFLTSRRVQHANYKLQLELAQRPGRLQQVGPLYRDKVNGLGYGFKVVNGPSEVTVSYAMLHLTYRVYRQLAIQQIDQEVQIAIRPHEFTILGVSGKGFGFRLAPYDVEEWRLPFNLPELSYETSDGKREQEIELYFAVTASGLIKNSEPLTFGATGRSWPFGKHVRSTGHMSLERTLLGILAWEAVGQIRSNNPSAQVPHQLTKLARGRQIIFPIELQNWLVDIWEQSGSFSNKSTEMFARQLVRLRPPHPDPNLLAAVIRIISHEPPPSIYLS